MVFVCDCVDNPIVVKVFEPFKDLVCTKCGSKLHEKSQLCLSEFIKVRNYRDFLDDEFVNVQCRQVFDAFKLLQPCTDRDVAEYLNIDRSSVNGRRNELIKGFNIPLIVAYDKKQVVYGKRKVLVTLWKLNKVVDVERELEVRSLA